MIEWNGYNRTGAWVWQKKINGDGNWPQKLNGDGNWPKKLNGDGNWPKNVNEMVFPTPTYLIVH